MREIKEVNVDAFKHLLAIPPRYVVLIPAVHCIYCELFLKSIFFFNIGFGLGPDL